MEREIEIKIIIDRIFEDINTFVNQDEYLFTKAPKLIGLGKKLESYYKELGDLNNYYKP